MKKSVIILISILYISAIVLVGFFGMKITAYDEMIYITDIECIPSKDDMNFRENNDGSKTIKIKYNPSGTIQENSIMLSYKVYPENATLKGRDAVMLYYDKEQTAANVNDLTISFKRKGVLTVYLKSLDGTNIIEKIKLIAY